jgi:hypothetical protein
MNGNAADRDPRQRPRFRRASALAATLASVTLLAAACGGSGSSGSVVSAAQSSYQQMVAYSQCMRSHGAPFWPDPSKAPFGRYAYAITPQISQQESGPGWQAALKDCQKLAPSDLPFTEAQLQAATRKLLKVVKCIRAHGYPNMPDPVIKPDEIAIGPPSGINPRSPQFQAALSTCQFGS